MLYTKENIEAICAEVNRRLELRVAYGETDIETIKADMLQGVYAALMATASNWPEIVRWMDIIEG